MSCQTIFKKFHWAHQRSMRPHTWKLFTVIIISLLAITSAAPQSPNLFSEYIYSYNAQVRSGPTGFAFRSKVYFEILYAANENEITSIDKSNSNGWLVRLSIKDPIFYEGSNGEISSTEDIHKLNVDRKYSDIFNSNFYIYANVINSSNGTASVKEIYTHKSDATTFKNIKKSILQNLLSTPHHLNGLTTKTHRAESGKCVDDNNIAQPELFSPDSISQVYIESKRLNPNGVNGISTTLSSAKIKSDLGLPLTIFETIDGEQNVTFRSRVFAQAESNLTTKFRLQLQDSVRSKGHESYDKSDSMASAIKALLTLHDHKYQADSIHLERERQICSHHHCGASLSQLYQDYKDSLGGESMASVEAAVAFLRILDRLRLSKGTNSNEILSILKKMKGDYGVMSSFLDILAAARTEDSITAAFKHVKLAKNSNLDTAERFLSVLSVAAKTASKMHLRRPLMSPYYQTEASALKRSSEARQQMARMASLEFIMQKLLDTLEQTPAEKWSSHKLRWSTLLTLATLVNANHQEHRYMNVEDEISQKVSNLLLTELEACSKSDTDCRIVVLQALGNVGYIGEREFNVIEEQALSSGKRESISAMKILRDLLSHQPKDQQPRIKSFFSRLKQLLMHVVYDNSKETTARVLAAELIVRFIPNSLASEQLLNHLPSFGNNELATMIYSRMKSLMPPDSDAAKNGDNWYWKSCITNGTSASFVRTMAKTETLNASYGVNVELLNKKKLLKESSFDVFLDTKERTQDLFSLGIFARGLSRFAGPDGGESSDGENSDDKNESMMAGMTLRLLGGYLRPYVFFSGYNELFRHVISGTASEPTTAFNGDLLLIDHEEGYPLISGFVAEQQMRGVLSIDVTGKVEISLWYKSSNSVVRTKAAVIVQASQSVYTAYDNLWKSHLFSFGGQALIDFIADSSFNSNPMKICLQVQQPEFLIR